MGSSKKKWTAWQQQVTLTPAELQAKQCFHLCCVSSVLITCGCRWTHFCHNSHGTSIEQKKNQFRIYQFCQTHMVVPWHHVASAQLQRLMKHMDLAKHTRRKRQEVRRCPGYLLNLAEHEDLSCSWDCCLISSFISSAEMVRFNFCDFSPLKIMERRKKRTPQNVKIVMAHMNVSTIAFLCFQVAILKA